MRGNSVSLERPPGLEKKKNWNVEGKGEEAIYASVHTLQLKKKCISTEKDRGENNGERQDSGSRRR